MVEVSEIGLKEEEVELDLGLSIGGSLRRSEKPVQHDSKPNGLELNPKDHQYQQQHQALFAKREATAVVDPKTKREIHALRRLEAKKKREEKQQQKRAVREPEFEPDHQQGVSKREKTDYLNGRSECLNVNLNLNGSEQQSAHCNTVGLMASFQHPYAYVQLNNGYAYPCVMPWMAKQNNAGPPATACKGFRPFSGNGYRPDLNGERDNGDKKAKSDVSSMCSSSVVSDHQSSSHEGRGSTDSHSHSAHSLAEPTQFNSSKEGNITSQPDQTASSNPIRSEHANVQSTNHNATQPDQIKSKEQGHTKTLSNETVMGKKPPKPQPQPQTSPLPSLPKMPYVSTTGNGPNGRRVNGFLYRYSNSEVSIVCVCHGSTFSPAGFVQHAGGTDTSHPERHITVIPPAFG